MSLAHVSHAKKTRAIFGGRAYKNGLVKRCFLGFLGRILRIDCVMTDTEKETTLNSEFGEGGTDETQAPRRVDIQQQQRRDTELERIRAEQAMAQQPQL